LRQNCCDGIGYRCHIEIQYLQLSKTFDQRECCVRESRFRKYQVFEVWQRYQTRSVKITKTRTPVVQLPLVSNECVERLKVSDCDLGVHALRNDRHQRMAGEDFR